MQFANQRMIQAIDLCAMCTPKEAGLVTLLFTALVNDVAKGVINGCYVRSWFLVQISRLIKGIFDEILVARGCELGLKTNEIVTMPKVEVGWNNGVSDKLHEIFVRAKEANIQGLNESGNFRRDQFRMEADVRRNQGLYHLKVFI